jgi:hypothetical protein
VSGPGLEEATATSTRRRCPDATWSSLGGVLTTNLYGLPDRVTELRARCDRLGILDHRRQPGL